MKLYPNGREKIAKHLRDRHRRGPDGLLPKPIPAIEGSQGTVETNTSATCAHDIGAFVKENELLKADNAKLMAENVSLKAHLTQITQAVYFAPVPAPAI